MLQTSDEPLARTCAGLRYDCAGNLYAYTIHGIVNAKHVKHEHSFHSAYCMVRCPFTSVLRLQIILSYAGRQIVLADYYVRRFITKHLHITLQRLPIYHL